MGACGSSSAAKYEATSVETSPADEVFANPKMVSVMKGLLRGKMNGLMLAPTEKKGSDPNYKEVQAFMVPSMFNPEDKDDHPMKNPRINWATFIVDRPYCVPGYESKAPEVGDDAIDGPLLSIAEGQPETTLLVEAKKLASERGSDKVVLGFDAITCPFWRAYAAQDLYKACGDVPILHIYQREAEPQDTFNAGGSQTAFPISCKQIINFHKSEAERRAVAKKAKHLIEKFDKNPVVMYMDGMDDKLEAAYESRPWRYYVLDVNTGKIIAKIGLAPFNMKAKCAVLSAACK